MAATVNGSDRLWTSSNELGVLAATLTKTNKPRQLAWGGTLRSERVDKEGRAVQLTIWMVSIPLNVGLWQWR